MDTTNEELLKLKSSFLQKQKSFYTACAFQLACLNKIKQLQIIPVEYNDYKNTPSCSLFIALDQRLILAYNKLEQINQLLAKTKDVTQLKQYITMFQIDYIDKDIKSAVRITKQFFTSNMQRGYIASESLNSLEQSNYLVCKLFACSIKQLQYCIDIIDSYLPLEKACDSQK